MHGAEIGVTFHTTGSDCKQKMANLLASLGREKMKTKNRLPELSVPFPDPGFIQTNEIFEVRWIQAGEIFAMPTNCLRF
jgi:hypothetical protein